MEIALGIVVAALAALTLGWRIYVHRRSTRPPVTVSGSHAAPVNPGAPGTFAILVTVANTGQVPVTISRVEFEVERQQAALAMRGWLRESHPLPAPLAPGEQWTAMVEVGRITGSLVTQYGGAAQRTIRPLATDAAGSRYRAKEWLDLS